MMSDPNPFCRWWRRGTSVMASCSWMTPKILWARLLGTLKVWICGAQPILAMCPPMKGGEADNSNAINHRNLFDFNSWLHLREFYFKSSLLNPSQYSTAM